jgi:hypothetical protein
VWAALVGCRVIDGEVGVDARFNRDGRVRLMPGSRLGVGGLGQISDADPAEA